MNRETDPQSTRRKVRDRSIVLVLVGIASLIGASLIDGTIAGVPIPLFYIFAIWALLIAGAFSLASPLQNSEENDGGLEPPDGTA